MGSKGCRRLLLGAGLFLILALILLDVPSASAARAKRPGLMTKIFGGSSEDSYAALDEPDDDDSDDYAAVEEMNDEEFLEYPQANAEEECDDESCEDAVTPDRRPMRGRRVVRKAGQKGQRGGRRKMGHRMYMQDDEMNLKDSPGSWHWYLLCGSLLLGTLAVTGGGANYAYLMLKSQFLDKLKPGLMSAEREDLTVEYDSETDTDEEEINPPAAPPNNNFEEEMKEKSEYLTLEEDFKSEPRATFNWCQSRGLLRSKCPYCAGKINHDSVNTGQFHCGGCSGRIHVLEGTWFDVKPMEIWKALAIPFHWTMGHNHIDAAKIIEETDGVTALWFKKCRDVTDFCLKTCDPTGPDSGEGSQVVTKDHYIDHDHANCSLYRLGGKGQIVEVDVIDKGQALFDKFVILCVDRDSGNTLALPTKAKTPRTVKQLLKKKLRDGTRILLPVDEETGRENRHYILPEFRKQLQKLMPKNQCLSEELLPVYVSQVMWQRKHEDCTYDHFRIMINHISKYFRFNQ